MQLLNSKRSIFLDFYCRTLSNNMLILFFVFKTHMLFSNSYITRSEKYFKDPLKFMPSRWEEGAEEKVHLYTSLPFGTGIRVCLGQRIAMQEIYLTLIKLVQNFEIHYLGEKPGFKIALIASPDIELKVSFRRRWNLLMFILFIFHCGFIWFLSL